MEFRILGPLEVADDGHVIALGGSKQRALLALLLLHANEIVPRDGLIESLWGDRAPETATTALQGYISALRKALGQDRILTHAPGYLIRVEPTELDLGRFESLVRDGRTALAGRDSERAASTLSEALALWRGPPLADLDSRPFAQAERRRLEEVHLTTIEQRLEADLDLGRHAEVVAELEALVAEHPLRELLRAQLMLALYRCGRQAEALETYQEARRLLVGELGLEPGASLRKLEQAILNHDPALEPGSVRVAAGTGRASRGRIAVLGALVVASAVAAAAVLLTRGDKPLHVVPNSLVKIDARTNRVVDVVPVGRFPGKVVAGSGSLWVVNIEDETLTRLRVSGRVETRGGLRLKQPSGLALDGNGDLWVGSFETNELIRVDTKAFIVKERLSIPGRTSLFVAVGDGSLWVTQPPAAFSGYAAGAVTRLDLATHAVEKRFRTGPGVLPGQITFGHHAAWVENVGDSSIWRIDADTDRVTRIPVGSHPTDIAVAFGSVWVPSSAKNAVWRINAVTNAVEAIIPVGRSPIALATGSGAVWVTNQGREQCRESTRAPIGSGRRFGSASARTDWQSKTAQSGWRWLEGPCESGHAAVDLAGELRAVRRLLDARDDAGPQPCLDRLAFLGQAHKLDFGNVGQVRAFNSHEETLQSHAESLPHERVTSGHDATLLPE